MFIDPVVDVFVDPCDPGYRMPSLREKEKFHEWTQRYVFSSSWNLVMPILYYIVSIIECLSVFSCFKCERKQIEMF